MFCTKYVPRVEREMLAWEYLSSRLMIESMADITKVFTERDLFCPEYVASE